MNSKTTRIHELPTETMETIMVARGRTYRIYPSDVIHTFRGQEAERIRNQNPKWSTEQVEASVDEILDQLCVGSSSCVYAKMTPEEQKKYESQYRFGGIVRVKK